jgi:hypothetical protein
LRVRRSSDFSLNLCDPRGTQTGFADAHALVHASHVIAAGVDIQPATRSQFPNVTLNIYGHLMPQTATGPRWHN